VNEDAAGQSGCVRLLALFPHRDGARELYREKTGLFDAGFYGAYSFPFAAPLAIIKRPLSIDELKAASKNLRTQTLVSDGKILSLSSGGGIAPLTRETAPIFDDYSVYGAPLSICAPAIAEDALLRSFEKIILTQALVYTSNAATSLLGEWGTGNSELLSSKAICFGAGYVANMTILPLGPRFSFRWQIGRAVWLPAVRKNI
jgi:hypothetical protein